MTPTLYSAWRATAPYRVRIGLALKGVAFDYSALDLIKGEQRSPEYQAVNPQRLTPALDIGGGRILTQSLSILEWLDEEHPDPPLLPGDQVDGVIAVGAALELQPDPHPIGRRRPPGGMQRPGHA